MFEAGPKLQKSEKAAAAPARIMLVDDSAVARAIFNRILSEQSAVEIVFEAENPAIALGYLSKHHVDIILLDIEMPGQSGLDALPELLARSNGARIMVVSSFAEENGPAAIHALSLGACDTLSKPGRSGFNGRFTQTLIDKVLHLGRSGRRSFMARDTDAAANTVDELSSRALMGPPASIAIGASTGGIPAIYEFMESLDRRIECPVFITQHLPDAFMAFFAKQLNSKTPRTVVVAEQGMIVSDNHAYLAPGDAHLIFRRDGKNIIIDHLRHYADSRYCPSVDVMFASVADVYGNGGIAVVLSGMGNDGTEGARLMAAKGAAIAIQNAETSVVWGMPGNIARQNLCDFTLSPGEIGRLISRTVTGHVNGADG